MTSQTRPGTCFLVYDCECDTTFDAWRDHGRNGYVTVPADSARWHIDLLISRGHTHGSIAAAVGVSSRTISRIRSKDVRMTARSTSDRIRGISADDSPAMTPHLVPVSAIKPLVDEMRRCGMTYADINRESGCSHSRRSVNVSKFVQYETWRRIVTLFELLARTGAVDGSLLDGHRGER